MSFKSKLVAATLSLTFFAAPMLVGAQSASALFLAKKKPAGDTELTKSDRAGLKQASRNDEENNQYKKNLGDQASHPTHKAIRKEGKAASEKLRAPAKNKILERMNSKAKRPTKKPVKKPVKKPALTKKKPTVKGGAGFGKSKAKAKVQD